MRRALVAASACALLTAALAGALAAPARADGDPASDYLITQKVFFPYDIKVTPTQQKQFIALVEDANRAGFTIRVALIGSSYDLGSIISLWRKPQTYARFLGTELKYVYKSRLLVVMPNGYGFNWPGHSAAPEYAELSKLPVKPGSLGILASSTTAVRALAKSSGVALSGTASVAPSSRNHDRLVIVLAAVAALAVAVTLRLTLRGRR
jgi:hypothetical protein